MLQRRDSVVIDYGKLLWQIQRKGLNASRFCLQADISRSSMERMRKGVAVSRSTVAQAAQFLELELEELVQATPVAVSPEELTCLWQHPEWEVIPETVMPFVFRSNGLVTRTAKVRHRIIDGEFGRAKVYDIMGLSVAARSQCREALSRHAVVSRKLSSCPQVAYNLTMTSLRDGSLWTAVDRWFDANPLSAELDGGPLPASRVHRVLSDVTAAIAAMHAEKIILRELHPDHILVRLEDRQCVVTDLELAKLLETEATVSSCWRPNPYRAPEIAGGECRYQADVYSCARLCAHLLTGAMLDYPADSKALQQRVRKTGLLAALVSALSPNWKKRPGSITILQDALAELEHLDD
jgi:hypothetical protein